MTQATDAIPAFSRKRESVLNLVFGYAYVAIVIVQGIFLVPLYLKYISTSLYGAWSASGNMLVWIGLIDPGLSRIMQQRVAHTYGRGELVELGRVIGTGLMLGTALSLGPLIALPASDRIAGSFSLPPAEVIELAGAFKLALIGTCVAMASFQPAAVNLGLQGNLGSGVSYITGALLGLATTVLMLNFNYGLIALPAGVLVRSGVSLIGNTACMWSWCSKNLPGGMAVRGEEVRRYAGLSVFTFIERVGYALLTQSDVYLTARITSTETAAVYTLTGRAFELVRMVAERLPPAFLPGLAQLAGEQRRERLTEIARRATGIVSFVVSVGAACVVALNFAFVKVWVPHDLFGGQHLTLALGCLCVTSVIMVSLAEVVYAIGGVGQIEIMRVCEGLVRVALQYFLLKEFGVTGIPLGACIGILLVSGWYVPRLAAIRLGTGAGEQFRGVVLNLGRALLLVGCGYAAQIVFERSVTNWNWAKLAGCGALALGLFGALGLAMNPAVRGEIGWLLRRFSARRVQAAKQNS